MDVRRGRVRDRSSSDGVHPGVVHEPNCVRDVRTVNVNHADTTKANRRANTMRLATQMAITDVVLFLAIRDTLLVSRSLR